PRRRRRVGRFFLHGLAVLTAIVAGLIVTLFSVDMGPFVKEEAEKRATTYLDRKMTIGRISAKLTPGDFVLHDVVIHGLRPEDRPFLKAKTLTVSLPWWTIANKELIVEGVEMTDWEVVIESYPGGRHNFPRVKGPPRDPNKPQRKRWFTTTLRQLTASRGHLTVLDHGMPWSLVAPNMRLNLFRRPARNDYGGTASFDGATIKIQSYEPFSARMQSRFSMNAPKLHFDHINLLTEGAVSVLEGDLQMDKWPEQFYRATSKIDIATQKRIFFNKDRFTATGDATFEGTVHYFSGGREIKGRWQSPVANVTLGKNTWRFPELHGDVLWLTDRLEITNARSRLYGGTADFDYRILSMDQKSGPKRAVWDVKYRDVDLVQLTDFLNTEGIRLAGRATGTNRLEWPMGGWAKLRGAGEVTVVPPPGMALMTREFDPELLAAQMAKPPEAGPFNPRAPLGYVPIGGRVTYKLDPEWITLGDSWVSTEKTHVSFGGRTAYYKRSQIPFHVTSLDWQEADRVFAGILTSFGSSTSAVPVGGLGEFDGVLYGAFNDPRIEGTFKGDQMRAFGVVWGRADADVIIEDSYANVSRSSLWSGESEINATGRFSLGYPRRDNGEQINARIVLKRRPLVDLRNAFELYDWPVEGLVSGEYTLTGNYETPLGSGTLLIEDGVAYGETFERATAQLKFEGTGVRAQQFDVAKSTGAMTGAAWIGWDGTYSFTADGEKIPVESLKTAEFPTAPPSGILRFRANGTGTFEVPSYDVNLGIVDLFAGDEGIGQLTGHLAMRGELLTVDFEAASPRLALSGAGRVAMTEEMDAELTLRFSQTSLDPYVRFFEPRLSPFTSAVAGGTVRVAGELANIDQLVVEARVEDLDLTLFDYKLKNDGLIEVDLNRHVAEIGQLKLRGEGTQLGVTGSISLHDSTIDVSATGDANLGILQGFFRDLRTSGVATLTAGVTGSLNQPVFSGKATVKDGRVRYFPMPRSLDAINGTLSFDADGIRLDNVAATLGGGSVVFGGRIAMDGFVPGELSLTATGERMRFNYPEGFRSEIDADLTLRGNVRSPVLAGNVTVRDAIYGRRFETDPNFFNFGGTTLPTGAPAAASAVPLRFDIRVDAPGGSLRIENNIASVAARADLRVQGTYDRPILSGRVEIDRGSIAFEGNRFVTTRGTIDFSNPNMIEPYFDIEAETRARVSDQTYRVTISLLGTMRSLIPTFTSDPPLSTSDVISVLLGQDPDLENAELRSFSADAASRSEADLIRGLGSRLLASPFSAPVGKIAEEVLGSGATVLIRPNIGTDTDPFETSAHIVIGKRISSRAYLTFSRSLGNTNREQILVLEYDQNDRIGWIITQNGERSFAVDFRVRHVF
ncbi:MAG TPA: translocation/assembly module TamB domain-containing protein, partial [Vicinamibacterales bacterium]|nr:translocation/assembly module TamB domain-containing protein [Vicinamibacterales bacterium]